MFQNMERIKMQHMERDMLSRVKGERIPDFGESRIKTPLFKAKNPTYFSRDHIGLAKYIKKEQKGF